LGKKAEPSHRELLPSRVADELRTC
jgi:hypothetical protein